MQQGLLAAHRKLLKEGELSSTVVGGGKVSKFHLGTQEPNRNEVVNILFSSADPNASVQRHIGSVPKIKIEQIGYLLGSCTQKYCKF